LSKSGVSKLAEAVSWFEEELKRLYDESVSKSNDLVRFGDDMARELREDIEAALAGIMRGGLVRSLDQLRLSLLLGLRRLLELS
jgi:hypothetical protein